MRDTGKSASAGGHRLALAVLICGALALACASWRAPKIPMRTVDLLHRDGDRCLVVLLPGRWDRPESFRRAGFAAAVTARGLPLDLVAADAHLGYYRDRSVVERLHADVIAPARAAGYERIWVAGVSLGGTGSLLYLRDRPQEMDGVLALAPYLGDDELIAEIEGAGGPRSWHAPEITPQSDAGRELWSWIAGWRADPPAIPLHLGWGTTDGLGRANRLLAGLLAPERVYQAEGGHDWRAWENLWEQFLDRNRPCASPRKSRGQKQKRLG